MRSRARQNYGITHSLTPIVVPSPPKLQQYEPQPPELKYNPLFTKNTFANPHTQRSRKHRLLQQKNTDIERQNRRLFEKLRKIKLKNAFQSESKLENISPIPQQTFCESSKSKPLSLPHVGNNHNSLNSLNSTKSDLNNILNDRKTFVSKYFEELVHLRSKVPKKTEELGNFICNGWKVKVLLIDEEFILLRGKQGLKELTKKYKWERVKDKMTTGLEDWVKFKFEFQD